MKDLDRKEDARLRAEVYAPRPTDSRLLYGVIAASLLVVGAIAVSAFYSLDLWRHPLALLALATVAFGVGLLVRRRQAHRHRKAHRAEYDRGPMDASADPPPVDDRTASMAAEQSRRVAPEMEARS